MCPKNNVPLARQKLLTSKPNTGETINNFLTLSKGLAEHCDYGEEEDNCMRDIVISNVTNKELKRISYRMKTIFKQSHERCCDCIQNDCSAVFLQIRNGTTLI